jgi:hypothetical protein
MVSSLGDKYKFQVFEGKHLAREASGTQMNEASRGILVHTGQLLLYG